ncbi:16S rRNA (cytidine(1402)-2'-O)-methyltransferase [Candidatus Gottesmanbacteria bacterium RIFCSPHIGHO2_02_FULL_39_14]|uniref:Ribosomal RNA small subunit methyltransferase I n=2 Tax=Candidatus Gottesmaniibacteriota TaxID=1752720 RepID=A0A1F5ZYA4_9BACT|nr:MAG: 16S rRNA (cytidine(1402)-2'-O)-methyltransferase [Candidatus Gottesmanbacteria bacterium RIFCSPHIGHO2_02_FULL_39_14]OGG32441.1 MAG: 16S rRNA (cytidine(1402)-2'-O)-methyltransferase [Candidatus Gottesmanbacteria bacterium RIFCSPLOWO2_02_FULL_38_8]
MNPLYIIATPIGNLDDISIRSLKMLFSSDVIACEDTRRTGQLIKNYESRIMNFEWKIKDLIINKTQKLISFYDEVEELKIPEIIEFIRQGKKVALVSDSGTPLISDPGYKLVRECLKQQIKVTVVPGPSALINALTVSGLPPNQFLFLGYLPAKSGLRIKLLTDLKNTFNHSELKPTVIFYESPHRLNRTLTDIKIIFGDIKVVIARELTKVYEEIFSENISEILKAGKNLKGEITLLFEIK